MIDRSGTLTAATAREMLGAKEHTAAAAAAAAEAQSSNEGVSCSFPGAFIGKTTAYVSYSYTTPPGYARKLPSLFIYLRIDI
jgi:hypothetical protein